MRKPAISGSGLVLVLFFIPALAFSQTYPNGSPTGQYPPGTYPQDPNQYPSGQYPARLPGGIPLGIPMPEIKLPKRHPKTDDSKNSGDEKVTLASIDGSLRKLGDKDLLLQTPKNRVFRFRLLAKTKFRDKAGEPVRDSLLHPGDHLTVECNPDDAETALRVILVKAGTASERSAAAGPVEEASVSTPTSDDLGSPRSVAVHEPAAHDSSDSHASAAGASSGSRAGAPRHDDDSDDRGEANGALSSPENDSVIGEARDAANSFTADLPNFLVQQVTTRYQGTSPSVWRALDVVTADVSCQNGEEQYKNIKVDGRPTSGPVENTGSWSTGEFVITLQDIFSPYTRAAFHSRGEEELAGRSALVYDLAVEQPNSHWGLVSLDKRVYKPAFKGRVWIDKETNRVLRIEQRALALPHDFAYDTATSNIDYGFVPIDGKSYLLPIRSENTACFTATSNCSRNVIEFRNYRKFGADSVITFDKFTASN